MAVRTAYDAVAGTALTATNLDKYPGGWIGYAEVTTVQSTISTIVDLTSLAVTVTAGTSRRVKITGYVCTFQTSGAGTGQAYIRNGANTQLSRTTVSQNVTTFNMHYPMAVQTPSTGSNTYKLSLSVDAGVTETSADALRPSFILVEDIGTAS